MAQPPTNAAQDPGDDADRQLQRALLTATRTQALAAIGGAVVAALALLISLMALVFSADGWRQQHALNEQQHELNQLARERQLRVYSSRVALWAEFGAESSSTLPAGLDVSVQNRSPVPLQRIRLAAMLDGGSPAAAELRDLPPCTISTFRLAPPDSAGFARDQDSQLSYNLVTLQFRVAGQLWTLAPDGLASLPEQPPPPPAELRVLRLVVSAVGDCGESG
ncbi:hypothetical protein [Catellatospora vulcania]|uniref:hypothetical protein n=1 Tax=Catellatospora vulcania TaxID=1460450 RepID=UPI0012D4540D|nr:hypothetical protein [Catellatospora vulcania]